MAMFKQLFTTTLLALSGLVWADSASVSAAASAPSRGAYLAAAGDCVACHTSDPAKPFTGGHGLATPMGVLYSTNITPDKNYGIGQYSLADFDAAVRLGRAKDGHALYPAMPFASYEKISPADMQALYRYFMDEVPAIAQANRDSEIPWPLNLRWPLKIWSALFTTQKAFVPAPNQSAEWNQGAYLVQGLGHCGTCHTPRGLSMAEQGLDHSSSQFLAGATLGGWYAPSLRGLSAFSDAELLDLLRKGYSKEHAFAGPMADVVTHSLSQLPEADLKAMMVYLRSLSPVALPAAAKVADLPKANKDQGALLYLRYCSTCHGTVGEGEAFVTPRLAGREQAQTQRVINLAQAVLKGAEGANIRGAMAYQMPAYADLLSDQQVADLVNFIQSEAQWGNQGNLLSAEQIGPLRSASPSLKPATVLGAALVAGALLLLALVLLWRRFKR